MDMDSIAWLETYLLNYPGAVFIVSHDRYFLDKVATKIVEIDNAKVTSFTGNYSAYSEKKAMLRRAAYQAYLNQQQEIKHQEAVIAKLKSFNREKSIRRAESREKMLDKIEVSGKAGGSGRFHADYFKASGDKRQRCADCRTTLPSPFPLSRFLRI